MYSIHRLLVKEKSCALEKLAVLYEGINAYLTRQANYCDFDEGHWMSLSRQLEMAKTLEDKVRALQVWPYTNMISKMAGVVVAQSLPVIIREYKSVLKAIGV